MSINYIKQTYVDILKADKVVEKYEAGKASFVNERFEDDSWSHHLKFTYNRIKLVEDKDPTKDIDNVKLLYDALKHIPSRHFAEESIWSYFTHIEFWNYMQKRWPVEKSRKDKFGYIVKHYFLNGQSDRALLDNGIARLWFIGYVTYDDTRKDPYEWTKLLLTNQEVLRTLSERPVLFRIKNFRLALFKSMQQNITPYQDRDKFRAFVMHFVSISGIKRLDSFTVDELASQIQKQMV